MSKRKQPDDEAQDDLLNREGPLTEGPIDNEYEHLDDDDCDDDLDEDGLVRTTKLKKDDYEEIMHAQEAATIAQEGEIKITPFNLTEELEDGDFDKSGNFIFKKKGDDEEEEGGRDTWVETIDWAKVELEEQKRKQRLHEASHNDTKSETNSDIIVRDEYTCFREMLRIMRPDETVQKTIRRLGNNIPRRRPFKRFSRRTEQGDMSGIIDSDAQGVDEAKRKLDLMIELANQRLQSGDMDIYGKTYEDLEETINS